MARIETHCEDTMLVLRTGYDWIEVHQWLDHWAKKWKPPIYLEYHRQILNQWNYEAALAGKLHLIRDVELYVLHGTGIHFIRDIKHEQIDELYEKALKYLPPRRKEPKNGSI